MDAMWPCLRLAACLVGSKGSIHVRSNLALLYQVDGERVVCQTGYHLVPFLFVTALLTYLDRGALAFAAPSLNAVRTVKLDAQCILQPILLLCIWKGCCTQLSPLFGL